MSSLLADSDSALGERLAEDLAEVERRFATELRSDLACVNELTEHVDRFRGKMLRPTLVLLSARALQPSRQQTDERHLVLATVVEMVHMATLVHDDVLDEAEMRRRGATINHLRGNEAAVMLGDHLISHAYHLCSSLGEPRISRAIAEATNRVCEGELLQLHHREDWDLDEATYFEMIRRKTAGFCGRCCELAGNLIEADPATRAALHAYGEKVGLAFQIVDDVLDLTGNSDRVGKTLGRDLDKGKLTLPAIRYLATLTPADRRQVQAVIGEASGQAHAQNGAPVGAAEPGPGGETSNGHPEGNGHTAGEDSTAFAWLAEALESSGAVEQAREEARDLVGSAKAALTEQLPHSPARQLLLSMADAVLDRDF
jgi:octaprenyl-diphosphate synthase